MKKIMLILVCLGLMAGSAFANDLAANIVDTKLSNNVKGTYFVDNATTRSGYILSTANSQGDKVYGGGSFVSEIYTKDAGFAGTTFATSDLIGSYSSTTFSSGWTAR